MKGIKREKVINHSGNFIVFDGLVPHLREAFVFVDKNQPLTGDAPKVFIREYDYGKARKNNPQKWPAYIAKVGHKYYPVESITEQLLTDLGMLFEVDMAESKLALASGQLRFLSKFFLDRDERLMHGAEIYAAYLSNDLSFVEQVEVEKMSREFFTLKFTYEALEYSFPEQINMLFAGLMKMMAFDAIVGNNDRHFYNWGIMIDVQGKTEPRFSPIYDTARALFWNESDQKIKSIFLDKNGLTQKIQNYAIKSKPKMGIESLSNLNHFQFIEEALKRFPQFTSSIKKVVDRALAVDEGELIDAKYRSLLSKERRALIKLCLNYRKESLKKILLKYGQADKKD